MPSDPRASFAKKRLFLAPAPPREGYTPSSLVANSHSKVSETRSSARASFLLSGDVGSRRNRDGIHRPQRVGAVRPGRDDARDGSLVVVLEHHVHARAILEGVVFILQRHLRTRSLKNPSTTSRMRTAFSRRPRAQPLFPRRRASDLRGSTRARPRAPAASRAWARRAARRAPWSPGSSTSTPSARDVMSTPQARSVGTRRSWSSKTTVDYDSSASRRSASRTSSPPVLRARPSSARDVKVSPAPPPSRVAPATATRAASAAPRAPVRVRARPPRDGASLRRALVAAATGGQTDADAAVAAALDRAGLHVVLGSKSSTRKRHLNGDGGLPASLPRTSTRRRSAWTTPRSSSSPSPTQRRTP